MSMSHDMMDADVKSLLMNARILHYTYVNDYT